MAKLTQGTQIYFRDPADDSIVAVECATDFDLGGSPSDQIETTCLESFVRTYEAGLRTPGQASMTINADPTKASHVRMFELTEENPQPTLNWVLGWSDGTDAPTWDGVGGEWTLPTNRTWLKYDGYIADFPFSFAQNTVVTTAISIQRTGGREWVQKA